MKTGLRIIGLLLVAAAIGAAEMRTWTFEKSGKTIRGEVVSFAGDTVTMKLSDGKAFSVPIAYLTESNRVDLVAERAKQWKEVEVVKLEGDMWEGRYKRCTVQGKEVSGEILIQLLPASVEAVLNNRKEQAAQIANLSDQIKNWGRELKRADALAPVEGDPGYVGVGVEERQRVNLAKIDLDEAKADLARRQAAYADYIEKTRSATIVKIRNTSSVYQGLPVWECPDPRKPQP